MTNNYFGIYVQALLAKNTVTTLQKQLKDIKDLQVKVTPTFGKINKTELDRVNKDLETQLINKLKDAGNIEIKPQMDKNAAKDITDSSGQIADTLEGELIPAVKNTENEFNIFKNITGKATETIDGLLGIVSKVAIWGIATNAVYGTKRSLEELFQTYVEIENKLISIQRVSDNLDMSKIFTGAYNSAQKYGATLTDMLSSTEEIARSYNNLNEEQVLATAQAGILASTIADMNGEDAVGTIIAVSNAYELAVEDGEKLIDMLNEVDNNYSVTSADIATAWEKSAATAKTFGVELNNLTGYIAAISTVTQESGDVIGNGLKTIFSRITTMKTATDAIKSAGVEIYDSFGQVRKVQDILADLAGNWNTLTDAQRQSIGVQVAGRYQLTRFLALMNNWNIATEASATALNSEGSAARENAIYVESYTAKLNQLENAQAQLSEVINNGNMAGIGKTWLDLKIAATELTTSFFKIADATTVLVGSIVVLIGFLSKTANGYNLLKNALMFFTTETKASVIATNIQTKGLLKNRIASVLATTATNLKAAAVTREGLAMNASTVGNVANAAANRVLATTSTVAAGAVGLLSKALFTIPGMFFVALIGVIAKVLIDSANAAKEAEKALSDEANAVSKSKSEIKDYVDKLKNLIELKKQLNKIEYDKTYGEDETKYLEALADKYKNISDELLSQNHSLEYKLQLIDKENAKLAAQKQKEYKKSKMSAQMKLVGSNEVVVDRDLTFGEKVAKFLGLRKELGGERVVLDDLKKKYQEVYSTGQDYYRLTGEISVAENDNINSIKELGMERAKSREDLDNLTTVLENIQKSYAEAGEQGIEPYRDALENLGYTDEEVGQILANTVSGAESVTDALTQYKSVLKEASDGIAEFNENNGEVEDVFFGVAEGTQEAIETMLQYIDMFGDKAQITKKMADDLAISFVFMGEKIFDSGEDLLANKDKLEMISQTLALAKENSEYYAQAMSEGTMYVAKGYEQEWEAVRSTKIAELTVEKETLENKIKIWQAVIDGNKTLAEASAEVARVEGTNNQNKVKSLRDYWNDFKAWVKGIVTGYKSIKDASKGDVETAQKNLDSLNVRLSDINNSITQWNNIKITGITASKFKEISDAATGASKKTIDYLDLAEAALLNYKSAVEAVDNELKVLQERNKQLVEGSKEWFDNIAAQQAVIARYKKSIQDYIAQIEIQLRNNNLEAADKAKLRNQIEDLTLEYAKLDTTLTDLTATQEKYYEGQISEKLDFIKKLEDQRHKDALANIKSEREAFQKQINEQLALMKKANQARTYEKELNELQEKRLDILNQISRLEGDDSRLARSRILDLSKELQDVETQISDLNYDRNNELREDALDDLSTQLDSYYDNLEELENNRNELILSSLEDAKGSLDNLNVSLGDLQNELSKWSGNLSNFSNWFKTFDNLVSTMPASNIVSSVVPVNSVDAQGNTNTTSIIFNITGATPENANNIGDTIVDNLKKAGVIPSSNNQ